PSPRSESLLQLRVCDPAMGAGAFLVAATRYLGEALLEAWRREGRAPRDAATGALGSAATSRWRAEARRAIAANVLRGVDKNPVAVSLARLAVADLLAPEPAPAELAEHLIAGDALLG